MNWDKTNRIKITRLKLVNQVKNKKSKKYDLVCKEIFLLINIEFESYFCHQWVF